MFVQYLVKKLKILFTKVTISFWVENLKKVFFTIYQWFISIWSKFRVVIQWKIIYKSSMRISMLILVFKHFLKIYIWLSWLQIWHNFNILHDSLYYILNLEYWYLLQHFKYKEQHVLSPSELWQGGKGSTWWLPWKLISMVTRKISYILYLNQF